MTSSVSLAQPAVAFLEDEFDLDRRKAVSIFIAVTFFFVSRRYSFLKTGWWMNWILGGTVFLVIFAAIETILFSWVFGMDKAWDEIHLGSDMTIPRVYKFIIKYVTLFLLLVILGMWLWQEWIPVIMMKNVAEADKPFVLATRMGLLAGFSCWPYW